MNKQTIGKLGLLAIFIGAFLIACTGTPAEKPTVKLIENPWSASELNVAVAKILLEEQLQYPVEVISLDENAQWPALAAGDADASLEVWPSGHANDIAEYIEGQKSVENGGRLGPVGKIGWYIPTYMVEQVPSLYSWEGFQDAANADLFATAETAPKGQFLGAEPSYVQYDEQIIKNLGLDLEVVFAGSEEALLAQLDAAYSRKAPIIFYLWTPHYIHAKYDLTQVELPAYSSECYAKIESEGVDCDYPADELFKIFSPALKDKAPEAYQFLKNMNYTTEDQISMMAAVSIDGKTTEEAARAWIEANESVWKKWLP